MPRSDLPEPDEVDVVELIFEPIWPWPGVLAVSIALLATVVWSYRIQLRGRSVADRSILLTLKLLAALTLIFAMIRPVVQWTDDSNERSQVLILNDTSRSMNTGDLPGQETRFHAMRADLQAHPDKWKLLEGKSDLSRFDFDTELRPLDSKKKEGGGDQTAIGAILESALREGRQKRTLAILLQSDGAQRAMAPLDADPLVAARKLAEAPIPIYSIVYGTSEAAANAADVMVEDLLVDPVVFEKKLVPMTARLRTFGFIGKKVSVRVLVEDRRGLASDKTGPYRPAAVTAGSNPVREIEITRDSMTIPLELTFVPDVTGEVKVAIEAVPLEGEVLTRNNRLETVISVRQGGLKVAYFDRPRPEQRGIRMVNGDDKIQLDFQEYRSGKAQAQVKIDSRWFQSKGYDVFILGDVPAIAFGKDSLTALAKRLEDGAGLMLIGGLQNFGAGGYAGSPIDDYSPVKLTGAIPAGAKPDLLGQFTEDIKVVPTSQGLRNFVMQIAPGDGNREKWLKLPPLAGANRLEPKSDLVQVLAASPEGVPLLMSTEVGRSRVIAFAGDTTYRWVGHGYGPEHQRFWRQMILWLARKEDDRSQTVWVSVAPRNFIPGATVPLQMGARDADGQQIADAEMRVQITDPDGEVHTVTTRRGTSEHSAEFLSTQKPGDYWVKVSASKGGKTLGLDAVTRFIIDPRDLELDNSAADPELLEQISNISGGAVVKREDLGALIERLAALKLLDMSRAYSKTLWDNWWIMIVFVSLMSLEWWYRKWRGMV